MSLVSKTKELRWHLWSHPTVYNSESTQRICELSRAFPIDSFEARSAEDWELSSTSDGYHTLTSYTGIVRTGRYSARWDVEVDNGSTDTFRIRKFDAETGLGGITRPLDWSEYDYIVFWVYPWTDMDDVKFKVQFWNDYDAQAPLYLENTNRDHYLPNEWNYVRIYIGHTERDEITRFELLIDGNWPEWNNGGICSLFFDYFALIKTDKYHSIKLLDTGEDIQESTVFNVPQLGVPLGDGGTSQAISRASRQFKVSGVFIDTTEDGVVKTRYDFAEELEQMLRGDNLYMLELPPQLGSNTLVSVMDYSIVEEKGRPAFTYNLTLLENQIRVWPK